MDLATASAAPLGVHASRGDLEVQEFDPQAATDEQVERASLSDVPLLDLADTEYRQFFLDLNQGDKDSLLFSESTADRDDDTLVQATNTDVPMRGVAGAGWIEAFRRNNGVADHELKLDDGLDLPGVSPANSSVEEAADVPPPTQECVGCDAEPLERASTSASGSWILMGSGLFLAAAVGLGQRRRHHRHRRHRRRALR